MTVTVPKPAALIAKESPAIPEPITRKSDIGKKPWLQIAAWQSVFLEDE
jgi:hypothetical protein